MDPRTHNSGRIASWLRLCTWLAIAVLSLLPAVALAQSNGGIGGAAGLSGEVQVQVDKFGAGNFARAGDWAGIRLRIQDTAAKQRELLVRLDGLDADGDTPEYVRLVTSNPGVWQGVWMYARLPFNFASSGGMNVSVFEATEVAGPRTEENPLGYKAGRRVGFLTITPPGQSLLKPSEAIIGMMGESGNRELGLGLYRGGQGRQGEAWHPQGHERSEIASGILPGDLPDRWLGLADMDVLVWGQGDPAELRGERAGAVREWVRRGGHLVIILPGVGQTWTNENSNDLIDIMPLVSVARKEVQDLSEYRNLIMRKPSGPNDELRPFPKTGVVHTFKPLPDAQPNEAMRIIDNPEGECIVARRLVGAGAVTLIGLDLNQTAFSQFSLVDADVFWHRILGRRGSLEEPKDTRLGRPIPGILSRQPWLYDQDIPHEISKTSQAAGGVLVGFVVFVLYWLVAGPLGFGLLKFKKWSQHAWAAFVLAAAVFTAISWTGASMLRPREVSAKHLTLLDHVYGQPVEKAKMWATLLIPWYGTARIAIAPPQEDPTGNRPVNAISSWESPSADASTWGGFPDVRGYQVDTKAPDSEVVPCRSTVKEIEAEWAGGPVWEMPRPARPEEGGTGKLVLNNVITGPAFKPDGTSIPMIEGTLIHNMPGALQDVVLVVVTQQTPINGTASALPVFSAYAFKQPVWKPGAGNAWDLGVATRAASGSRYFDRFDSYVATFKRSGGSFSSYQVSSTVDDKSEASHDIERLTGLAFFSQFEPPVLSDNSTTQYAAQRAATHGWDLSLWFTHPCVMIVGYLDEAPSPVPLTVDGKAVPTTGRTFVRWVYPLPDNPPEYSHAGDSDQPKEDAPAPPAPEPEQPQQPSVTTAPGLANPPKP